MRCMTTFGGVKLPPAVSWTGTDVQQKLTQAPTHVPLPIPTIVPVSALELRFFILLNFGFWSHFFFVNGDKSKLIQFKVK